MHRLEIPEHFEDPTEVPGSVMNNIPASMSHGFLAGLKFKKNLLLAIARGIIQASQIACFSVLIFQMISPARFTSESCVRTREYTDDLELMSYLYGFLFAFLAMPIASSAYEATSKHFSCVPTINRVDMNLFTTEITNATGNIVFTYLTIPGLPVRIAKPVEILLYVFSSYPIFCMLMKKYKPDFTRGDYETYREFFQNNAIKRRAAIFFESVNNGIDLASCLSTVAGLLINLFYNASHEQNYSSEKTADITMAVCTIGFLVGIVMTARNSWLIFISKIMSSSDLFYTVLIETARLQGCREPNTIYNPNTFSWPIVSGLAGIAAFAAAANFRLACEPYELVEMERYLIKYFKCHPLDPWLKRMAKYVMNLPIALLNAWSPSILAEYTPEHIGYLPVSQELLPFTH
jgi:hypothetical protein